MGTLGAESGLCVARLGLDSCSSYSWFGLALPQFLGYKMTMATPSPPPPSGSKEGNERKSSTQRPEHSECSRDAGGWCHCL